MIHRLNALVKALTHHQIRELRLSLEEVDLHCDIITKLPLELSQIILRRLSLSQVFQARRVSSRWNQILSSPQTLEPLICDWFPAVSADVALHIPHGLSASSIQSLKAEHIEAYLTGHAFTNANHEWDCFPDVAGPGKLLPHFVAYADGIMAWVDTTDSPFVKSLDLRTGQEWSFLPEARTSINAIAMSSSMVAALGSGRCHVWNFWAGERYYLRLPSDRWERIAVSGESLAIVTNRREGSDPYCELTTWTLKNQRTASFCVNLSPIKGRSPSPWQFMFDNKGESLLLFEWSLDFAYGEDGLARFHYVRISLDGEVLNQGVLEVSLAGCCHDCSQITLPKEANGRAVLWSFAKHQRDGDNFHEMMLIYYNFRESRLEVRTQEIAALRIMDSYITSSLFYWKDAAYFLEYSSDSAEPDLLVIDLQDSTCNPAKMDFAVNNQNSRRAPKLDIRKYNNRETDAFLLGDETFLVSVSPQGFCVWCFDANVGIFNEYVPYAEERKRSKEERLRLKQKRKSTSSDESCTRKSKSEGAAEKTDSTE